jgi:hypothetical protein
MGIVFAQITDCAPRRIGTVSSIVSTPAGNLSGGSKPYWGAALAATEAQADCKDLPSHSALQEALQNAVYGTNAGLNDEMWGTIVDRDGIVCEVAFIGDHRGDQWSGSRVISAQKANTANASSLPADAGFGGPLSSGNLYAQTLPGGSLFELPESNPVDPGCL